MSWFERREERERKRERGKREKERNKERKRIERKREGQISLHNFFLPSSLSTLFFFSFLSLRDWNHDCIRRERNRSGRNNYMRESLIHSLSIHIIMDEVGGVGNVERCKRERERER